MQYRNTSCVEIVKSSQIFEKNVGESYFIPTFAPEHVFPEKYRHLENFHLACGALLTFETSG